MRVVRHRSWILALGPLLAGCAGPELIEDDLTQAEADELVGAAMMATFDGTSVLPPSPPATSTGSWSTDFEAEYRCPAGGAVMMAVEVAVGRDPDGATRAAYRLAQVHDECRVRAAEPGRMALWGNPRTEVTVLVVHGPDGGVDWSGSAVGRLDWVAAARRGSCAFEVTLSGRAAPVPGGAYRSGAAEVTGTACGYSVDRVVSIR